MALKRKGWGKGGSIVNEFGNMIRWATTMRETARVFRKNMTPAERILWEVLRRKQFHGIRFYRQVAIDRYIADFYCPKKAIIIEVDGRIHDEEEQKQHDEIRKQFLLDRGFRILRVKNEDVCIHLPDVLKTISEFCGVSSPSPPLRS